jgi:predicted CXXCH cytochrome family protein
MELSMKMSNEMIRRLVVIVASLALLASADRSARNAAEIAADERCLSCHVGMKEVGFTRKNLHWPFFDLQCVVCHIEQGSYVSESEGRLASGGRISGTLVSQERMWRKRLVLPGTGMATADHVVPLGGLDADRSYRFRILLSTEGDPVKPGSDEMRTLWLGLRPAEFQLGTMMDLFIQELDPESAPSISSLQINRTEGSLIVSWQSNAPALGLVELEALDGITLESLGREEVDHQSQLPAISAGSKHAGILSGEDLAIRSCILCHGSETARDSHPVEVYANGDSIRIPDDLPTVSGGMVTCVTCHEPHSSDGKALTRKAEVADLCEACHVDFSHYSPADLKKEFDLD